MVPQRHITICTLLFHFLSSHGVETQEKEQNHNNNQSPDATEVSGILNSYVALKYYAWMEWTLNEFTFSKLSTGRCKRINHDPLLLADLANFVDDYGTSTFRHLLGVKEVDGLRVHEVYKSQIFQDIVASNLVLVFRMIYRFTRFGDALRNFVSLDKDPFGVPVCNVTYTFLDYWPGARDYHQILSTLVILYKIHSLHVQPEHMVDTLGDDSNTSATLTARMCFDIAITAAKQLNYVDAFDWINYSLHLTSQGDTSISPEEVEITKLMIVENHNIDFLQHPTYDTRFFMMPIPPHVIGTPQELTWGRRKDHQDYKYRGNSSFEYVHINMWSLCADINLQSTEVLSKLKCFTDQTSHPWFRINPLRVEALSENNQVLQFHDILGDDLISKIIQQIENSDLFVSATDGQAAEYNTSRLGTRSSAQIWLPDEAVSPSLNYITEFISGREVKNTPECMATEPYQAVEYVVGRHYVMHTDTGREFADEVHGDRLSTLLFYLNDVDLGGITGFGNLGIAATPKKGSAIFWNNLYRNGTIRTDMFHCSCPVIKGRKLVINKWFHHHANFLKYPCSLNQFE